MDRCTVASAVFVFLLTLSSAVASDSCNAEGAAGLSECDATSLLMTKHEVHKRAHHKDLPDDMLSDIKEEAMGQKDTEEDPDSDVDLDEDETEEEAEQDSAQEMEDEQTKEAEEDDDITEQEQAEDSLDAVLLQTASQRHKHHNENLDMAFDLLDILHGKEVPRTKLPEFNLDAKFEELSQRKYHPESTKQEAKGVAAVDAQMKKAEEDVKKISSSIQEATEIDPKVAVLGTKIVGTLEESLKLILKNAGNLDLQASSLNTSLPEKIIGTSRKRATELQKEVEVGVGAFLKKWTAMIGMLNTSVSEVEKVLKMADEGKAAGMIDNFLNPVTEANTALEEELKKVKQSVSGFDSKSMSAIAYQLEELDKHLKKTQDFAKEYTKRLDRSFGLVLAGMSDVIGSALKLPPVIVSQMQLTFDNIGKTENQITAKLLSSVDKLVSGIKTGMAKTKLEPPEKSAGHRNSAFTVAAVAAVAVAASFVGF